MDYNFTISAYDAGTTYSKHSIVYVLTGSLRTYYYSLIDNNLNNTPVLSPTQWTTNFYWTPNYSTSADLTFKRTELQLGDGYSQRMRNGLNSNPLSFNLVFDSRSDDETKSILHFVEQKGGVDPFVYNPQTIFNRTGLKYIAIDPKWTSSAYNINNVTITLQRVFDP